MFWFSTVVGQAILLIGIAALGGREVSKNKMSLLEVQMSLAHLCVLKAHDPLEAARPRLVRRRFGKF
jgi:hypothetical protein